MAYLALYREWRPQTFHELVGQEHVSRTLLNAITYKRIAHAYLFCGPRGTGKTTTAKILAKALNCTTDGKIKPCNQCANCQAINSGASHDVLEIDAASNRGVDEIRELREQVKYAPQEGTYKVYIIDEVHMLTTEAFNALLKTLEEPPANVIFVLATTEVHKIPATILSRCQRFDFRRLAVDEIANRLDKICGHHGIEATRDTLLFIARKAEGGMRDALGILDQCVSFAGQQIGTSDVTAILGAVADEVLFELSQGLAEGRLSDVLLKLNELINRGKEVRPLTQDLIEHFRDRLILKTVPSAEDLVDMPGDIAALVREKNDAYQAEELQGCISLLSQAENDMKWTTHPRILLEVAFVRISRREWPNSGEGASVGSTAAAGRRAAVLNGRINGGSPQGGAAAASMNGAGAFSGSGTAIHSGQGISPSPGGAAGGSSEMELRALRRRIESLEAKLRDLQQAVESSGGSIGEAKESPFVDKQIRPAAPIRPVPVAAPEETMTAAPSKTSEPPLSFDQVNDCWPDVLGQAVERISPLKRSILRGQARLAEVEQNRIILVHDNPLFNQTNDPRLADVSTVLKEEFSKALNRPVVVVLSHESQWKPSPAAQRGGAPKGEAQREAGTSEAQATQAVPLWADPTYIREKVFHDPNLPIEFVDDDLDQGKRPEA
ncbi:DNA polymerase III subunit gamma/tau [Heliobacterium mobile]|nr:DNA polymerase III subunit gamma/tau [Heliobacterium mobile]